MGHPLIDRLTDELGWPSLTTEGDLNSWTARSGTHVLFVPGDWQRNLETADVAVILPELQAAFQGRFDCAVVGDEVQARVKETSGINKTPSLIFFREGTCLGGIPKVRDWDDYIAGTARILNQPVTA